jgi:hypothetical protein
MSGHDHPGGQGDVRELIETLPPAGGGGAARLLPNPPAPDTGADPGTPILPAHGDARGARRGIIIAA